METLAVLVVISCCTSFCLGVFFDFHEISSDVLERFPANLSFAIKDIAESLPATALTIVRGKSTNIRSEDMSRIASLLNAHNIQIINIDLSTEDNKKTYYTYLTEALDISVTRTSFILCEPYECEAILAALTDNNFIHRSLLYMFYWHYGPVSEKFLNTMMEAMRIAVITNPRPNVFRVYYNQASPDRLHHLTLVNWWSGQLYKSPLLPPPDKVYHDFKGRVFNVPVLHAPPWHFVQFNNDSTINVTGGRDEKLLALLAHTLNFQYKYYDPPDRSQGSGITANGTFKGTLGLIWKRNADFFLGDVTMTWERLQGVEFSFLTLADSGAFVTHAPSKLSEALALIRPFRWDVWPLVVATMVVAGPALWAVIAAPALWSRRVRQHNLRKLLAKCCWFTTTLFLRQSAGKEPSTTHKARLVAVLVSLGATYVIGDMYSANLTSLLAKPAREQPVGTLQALEEAMRDRGYELVVERHSSSLAILQNGTGVYGRLAKLMKRQRVQSVCSVERGVRLVLRRRTVAVLGGRETLYFDTKRFGANNFHLSEKLYTRYSAIALQVGCPYVENVNSVVMKLFEAGILSKMTTDEYEKLGERRAESVVESERDGADAPGDLTAPPQADSTQSLEPVSLRMLNGAFFLLAIGHLLAALTLACELESHRRQRAGRARAANGRTHRVPAALHRARAACENVARRFCVATRRVVENMLRNLDY